MEKYSSFDDLKNSSIKTDGSFSEKSHNEFKEFVELLQKSERINSSYVEDEYCDGCGANIKGDEFAENGYCFTCVMSACTPGNHY